MELTFFDIKKVMRGYDVSEVDNRARQFSNEYEELLTKYNNLKSDYEVLKSNQNDKNLINYQAEQKIINLEIENRRLQEKINELILGPYILSDEENTQVISEEGLEFIE